MHNEEPDLAVDEHLDGEWRLFVSRVRFGREVRWSTEGLEPRNPMLAANGDRGVTSTHLEYRRAPLQGRKFNREALVEGGGAVLGADCPVAWMGGGVISGMSVGRRRRPRNTDGRRGTYEAVRRIIAARRCRANSTCSSAERPITRLNASLLTKRPQPSSPAVLR